jgi:hypothetical protein
VQTRGSVTVVAERYELERELVRRPSSLVWLARDTLLDRAVELTIVRPSLADDDPFRQRLDEDTRRIASLRAPSFAQLLDTGEEDGVPFLVHEHAQGVTLRQRLDEDGPLPVHEAVALAVAVLDALVPVHDAGLSGLDLRLETITVRPSGDIRIAGAAAVAFAPAEPRSDVVAVADILFELVTGQARGDRRSIREIRAGVPRRIDRAFAHAIGDEAPTDPASFADALQRAVRTAEENTGAEGTTPRRRGVLRTWLAVPIAVAIVAVAVIVTGLWLGRLEVGGPLGIRAVEPSPQAGNGDGGVLPDVVSLRPLAVAAVDPAGDGQENSSGAPAAIDGDRTTAWRSENYFDGDLHKDGMGLVFDLGETRDVVGFRLWTPHPGFVFHVAIGDDPEALVGAIGGSITAQADTTGSLAASGRFVLVWITTVVDAGDGNRAEVAEFRALVAADA